MVGLMHQVVKKKTIRFLTKHVQTFFNQTLMKLQVLPHMFKCSVSDRRWLQRWWNCCSTTDHFWRRCHMLLGTNTNFMGHADMWMKIVWITVVETTSNKSCHDLPTGLTPSNSKRPGIYDFIPVWGSRVVVSPVWACAVGISNRFRSLVEAGEVARYCK